MAKYNHNESLGKNAMRGVDITEPELPLEITNEKKYSLDYANDVRGLQTSN